MSANAHEPQSKHLGRVWRTDAARRGRGCVRHTMDNVELLHVCSALSSALVGIGGGRLPGPDPVLAEGLLFAVSWPDITTSVMRILLNFQWRNPRALAAVVVCVLLLIFDGTLGFPGEGPAGANLFRTHATGCVPH